MFCVFVVSTRRYSEIYISVKQQQEENSRENGFFFMFSFVSVLDFDVNEVLTRR